MKKSTNTALIVAVGCVLLGGALIAVSRPAEGFEQLEAYNASQIESKSYDVAEPFQSVCVQEFSMDVRILPAQDGECRVVCCDSDRLTHTVNVEDGVLTVTAVSSERWYDHIGFFWGNREDSAVTTIYLPEQEYQMLRLSSASGEVSVSGGLYFDEVRINSSSGDIDFSGNANETLAVESRSGEVRLASVYAGTAQVKTNSGDIELSDVQISGEVSIEAKSGSIELESMESGSIRAETNSGDIDITDAKINGEAFVEAKSGDVELERFDAASIRIETKSGDVEGLLLSGKNFVTQTQSGECIVPMSEPNAGICEISTSSGDIHISIG